MMEQIHRLSLTHRFVAVQRSLIAYRFDHCLAGASQLRYHRGMSKVVEISSVLVNELLEFEGGRRFEVA